jgi:tRNA(fMet)-specific endonuclease VapC
VLPIDLDTAHFYGAIKQKSETSGRRIPDNDTWIAAIALQHGLVLISNDRHFDSIDNLTTEKMA